MFTAYGIIAISLSFVIGLTQVGRRGNLSDLLCIAGIGLLMSGVCALFAAAVLFAWEHLP
jgi:hypothetical protein